MLKICFPGGRRSGEKGSRQLFMGSFTQIQCHGFYLLTKRFSSCLFSLEVALTLAFWCTLLSYS